MRSGNVRTGGICNQISYRLVRVVSQGCSPCSASVSVPPVPEQDAEDEPDEHEQVMAPAMGPKPLDPEPLGPRRSIAIVQRDYSSRDPLPNVSITR